MTQLSRNIMVNLLLFFNLNLRSGNQQEHINDEPCVKSEAKAHPIIVWKCDVGPF